jgi:hypothetical protein
VIARRLVAIAGTAVFALATSSGAIAHPTALTSVTVVVGDTFAEVIIATDADALRLKLDALQLSLADCIDLRADGVRLPLVGEAVPLRLHARLPAGARRLTWSTSLVLGSYPVVIRGADGRHEVTEWLQGRQPSAPYRLGGAVAEASRSARIAEAVALGFTHIVPNGLDHILFVLGLFFLTTRLRTVFAQVTAFTVAHSITLGLTLYGVVSLPAAVVEPLIALSIAYVAIENLVTADLKPWRLALVFGFGLLHGMGFAEALSRLGLPRSEFLTTLVSFNAGVEAGQLAIIAVASMVVSVWALPEASYRRFVVVPASVIIGLAGVVWTIQRL